MMKFLSPFSTRQDILGLLLLLVLGASAFSVSANCTRKNFTDTGGDNFGASLHFGNVNLTSDYIQPAGTVLATTVISLFPSHTLTNPDTVLYECDITDKDDIYEVFATNGDSNVGGYTDLGDNYFQTYFRYTALKITHIESGLAFTRMWQKTPLKHYAIVGDKIEIRAKDFSQLRAELIKTDKYDPTPGPTSWGCVGPAAADYSGSYSCNQPAGYVTFDGPGIRLPEAGKDSAYNYPTWGSGRYIAFGMNTAPVTTITHTNTCAVRDTTPLILFPTITLAELNSGGNRTATFNVEIECQDGMVSGVNSGQTSVAIQTSLPAYIAAQKLNLVNGSGGISYLLSDGYGADPAIATGVGIRLEDSAGARRFFIGWGGCDAGCASTVDSGWYPVLSNTSANGSSAAGYTNYESSFNAVLESIPGQTPTTGKVNATAYVLIKVQ